MLPVCVSVHVCMCICVHAITSRLLPTRRKERLQHLLSHTPGKPRADVGGVGEEGPGSDLRVSAVRTRL